MKRWNAVEDANLREWKAAGVSDQEIATRLSRSLSAVVSRWYYMNLSQDRKDRKYGRRLFHFEATTSDPRAIPDHVLADRAARATAARTITGWLLGDPVLSQSALAKKQGAGA